MPFTKKGGPIRRNNGVRYIPDKEQKCLTEDQARHINKKVEMDKIINTKTMKQEKEDDEMTRNKLSEEDTNEVNPRQMVILNKVYNNDIKTEHMKHWSILSD